MSKPVASTSASITRLDVFGPPPLLGGEDAAAYNELLARISAAVKPTDIVEEIWVRDIVDLASRVFVVERPVSRQFLPDLNSKLGFVVVST